MSKFYGPRRKVKSIGEVEFPEEILAYGEIYDKLINLNPETVSDSQTYLNNFLKANPHELYMVIYLISKIWISRPKQLKLYADLIVTIMKSHSKGCHSIPSSFSEASSSKDIFIEKLSLYLPLVLEKRKCKLFKADPSYSSNRSARIEDLLTIYPQNTAGFYIINDMLPEIQTFMADPNYKFNLQLVSTIHSTPISPIELAARFGSINIFKFFLLNNIEFSTGGMFDAIIGGNYEIIRTCENLGTKCEDPFEVAVMANQNDVADWFLENQECKIIPPAQIIENGNLRALIFGILNKSKLDVSYNRLGLLARVSDLGSLKLAEYSINCGADPSKQTTSKKIPLSFAAINKDVEMAKLLLQHNSPVNLTKRSPLHDAAESGSVEICKLLIENHADVNQLAAKRWTPLHFAAWNNNIDVAKCLVDNGADINAMAYKLEYGMFEDMTPNQTPLMFAALQNNRDFALFLVDKGAEIDDKSRKLLKIRKKRAPNGTWKKKPTAREQMLRIAELHGLTSWGRPLLPPGLASPLGTFNFPPTPRTPPSVTSVSPVTTPEKTKIEISKLEDKKEFHSIIIPEKKKTPKLKTPVKIDSNPVKPEIF
ncbi:hypothetical protein TVAG_417800 [Trichomonas vaginalis G3]|uniref:Uncharacterized protein n=1 Tax=Trichomonas vaginalis (strain ATCC PRA-98 / G3) TaxID=412133 RepID=A2EDA0_TRIV3|nr:spectrin binding [Trichomonas vaginalis G3]EAY09358.1 hypothetical protein TVAG_417800 [Trichomonas vaginalis G3]KAI5501706.1 spectrin binding [Trichomonas vaginalis G3]|eukprot:XP_001321581.1 hypothetical protein [Trichomonas vaginalis G3]